MGDGTIILMYLYLDTIYASLIALSEQKQAREH